MLKAIETGLVDSVQVVYNVFDQAPEDALFRVREGGHGRDRTRPLRRGEPRRVAAPRLEWPQGDWRNLYFTPDRLRETLARVDQLRPLVPPGSALPDLALRFILHHPAVSTTIPGMRRAAHVETNLAAGDAPPLPQELVGALRATAGSVSGGCSSLVSLGRSGLYDVFVARNRRELIAALNNGVYPPPSSTPSSAPKIVYVDGTMDANVDDANRPLSCEDYNRNGYTPEAYLQAYDPAVWGTAPPTGTLRQRVSPRSRRECASGSAPTPRSSGAPSTRRCAAHGSTYAQPAARTRQTSSFGT